MSHLYPSQKLRPLSGRICTPSCICISPTRPQQERASMSLSKTSKEHKQPFGSRLKQKWPQKHTRLWKQTTQSPYFPMRSVFPRTDGILLEVVRDREGRDNVFLILRIQEWRGESLDSPPLSDAFVKQSYRSRKGTNKSLDASKLEMSHFFHDFPHCFVHLLRNPNGVHLLVAAMWSSLFWPRGSIPDHLPKWLQRLCVYPGPLYPAIWARLPFPISPTELLILAWIPSRTCSM